MRVNRWRVEGQKLSTDGMRLSTGGSYGEEKMARNSTGEKDVSTIEPQLLTRSCTTLDGEDQLCHLVVYLTTLLHEG
jgi:hypothetical protein